MARTIVNLERHFQMWLYTASHGQLLLRSNRSDLYSTRVDVLFKNVTAVQLRTDFDLQSILEVSINEVADGSISAFGMVGANQRIFMLVGPSFSGHVVAGALHWHEDVGQHFDDSFFQASLSPLRA